MSLNKRIEALWDNDNAGYKTFILNTGQELELIVMNYDNHKGAAHIKIELYATPFEILEALDNLKLVIQRQS